jgi:hypothetical protein
MWKNIFRICTTVIVDLNCQELNQVRILPTCTTASGRRLDKYDLTFFTVCFSINQLIPSFLGGGALWGRKDNLGSSLFGTSCCAFYRPWDVGSSTASPRTANSGMAPRSNLMRDYIIPEVSNNPQLKFGVKKVQVRR